MMLNLFFQGMMFTFETSSHGVPKIMQILFKLAITPFRHTHTHTHKIRMQVSESEDIIGRQI